MLRIFKNQFMDDELSRGIEVLNLVKKTMVEDKSLRELGIKNVL